MFLPDNRQYIPVENPNMDFFRTSNERLDINKRLTTYEEIDRTFTEAEALNEASRCLHCPTHWCQNACPAGVPVADFIEKIRQRDYDAAYRLIRTASTLPEMCSRLCPQEKQCQSNCTRGICSQSVAIGKLERFVADWHRQNAGREQVEKECGKTAAIIGAGPSGLAAARKLNELGCKVTVFDKNERPGGLLYAGIPNMKIEKHTLEDMIRQMEDAGIQFICGTEIDAEKAPGILDAYDAVILAAGTQEARTPVIEGRKDNDGIYYAVEYLASNTRAYLDKEEPEGITAKDKDVIIIGGGDTGNDCVGMAIRNGCRSVTQIEIMPERMDKNFIFDPVPQKRAESRFDCSQEECLYAFCKDPHIYSTSVKAVNYDENGALESAETVKMSLSRSEDGRLTMMPLQGTEEILPCNMLIIAAGFIGMKKKLLEDFQIQLSEGYRTSNEKIFCCGDCRTGQSLVVKSMVDGQKCAKEVYDYITKGK